MPKGTCQDEATLNREKIKPVALVIIELRLFIYLFKLYSVNNNDVQGNLTCLKASCKQASRQFVSRKFHTIIFF